MGHSSDHSGMAECRANTFSQIYTATPPTLPAAHQVSDTQFSFIPPSLERVKLAIDNLDKDTSMGPVGIHPLALKTCQNYLAYPIFLIYTKMLNTGQVPSASKSSNIVPIFKKGLYLDPLNYHPVSLTFVYCKMLERIIVEQFTIIIFTWKIIQLCLTLSLTSEQEGVLRINYS